MLFLLLKIKNQLIGHELFLDMEVLFPKFCEMVHGKFSEEQAPVI